MLSKNVRLASGLFFFLVGHCVRLVSFLLSPFLFSLLVFVLVSLLGGHCVRLVLLLFHFVSGLVALLVDALKSGLGNAASLLSHLFEVYGGVIFVLNGACFQEILAGLPTFPFLQ